MMVTSSGDLKREAKAGDRGLSVDVARRRLRVTGGGDTLDATDFGLVQTAARWASVTGTLRGAVDSRPQAFVLVVDEASGDLILQIGTQPPTTFK